jgi:hypothetical protein
MTAFAPGALETVAFDGLDLFGNNLLAGCHGLRGHGLGIGKIDTGLDHHIGDCQPENGASDQKHCVFPTLWQDQQALHRQH